MEKATKALEEILGKHSSDRKIGVAISTKSRQNLPSLAQELEQLGITLRDENKQYATSMIFTQLTQEQMRKISSKPYVRELFYLEKTKIQGKDRYKIH